MFVSGSLCCGIFFREFLSLFLFSLFTVIIMVKRGRVVCRVYLCSIVDSVFIVFSLYNIGVII